MGARHACVRGAEWRRGVSIGDTLAKRAGSRSHRRRRSASGPASARRSSAASSRDDFSACGGDFYARGHIRSIAPGRRARTRSRWSASTTSAHGAPQADPGAPTSSSRPRRSGSSERRGAQLERGHGRWRWLVVVGFGVVHVARPGRAAPAARDRRRAGARVPPRRPRPRRPATRPSVSRRRRAPSDGGHPADRGRGLLGRVQDRAGQVPLQRHHPGRVRPSLEAKTARSACAWATGGRQR